MHLAEKNVIGRVSGEPTLHSNRSDVKFCLLHVQTNDKYYSKMKQSFMDNVLRHKVVIYGKRANEWFSALGHGDIIAVSGKLQGFRRRTDGGEEYEEQIVVSDGESRQGIIRLISKNPKAER